VDDVDDYDYVDVYVDVVVVVGACPKPRMHPSWS
jgi:hypothetical protein